MALTNTQVKKWADALWDGLYHNESDSVYTLSDGRKIKLEIVPDDDNDTFHGDEFFGQVAPSKADPYTGYSKRPDGFNGAARKFDTRDGRYWWQPPDGVNDPHSIEQCFDMVRGYYNGDWWYVGVVVSIIHGADCIYCQHGAKVQSASVWGVESNHEGYLKETIGELIREAYSA